MEEVEKEGGGISEGGMYIACCAGRQAVIVDGNGGSVRVEFRLGSALTSLQRALRDSTEEEAVDASDAGGRGKRRASQEEAS